MIGPKDVGGLGNMHSAAPRQAMTKMHEHLGVSMEMFASPFNCHFDQYCSAFVDTDSFFGSLGSFFDYPLPPGSYELNPPFTEEVFLLVQVSRSLYICVCVCCVSMYRHEQMRSIYTQR